MTQLDLDPLLRCWAIACASQCWKGEPDDSDGVQALADEFLQYIKNDKTAQIPRPDKASRGRLPRP